MLELYRKYASSPTAATRSLAVFNWDSGRATVDPGLLPAAFGLYHPLFLFQFMIIVASAADKQCLQIQQSSDT